MKREPNLGPLLAQPPKSLPSDPPHPAAKSSDDSLDQSFAKDPEAVRSYMVRNLVLLVVGIVALVTLAYLAQRHLGHNLEAASRWLTNSAGYPGVFLSIWLIDTFTLPISPDVILAFVAHRGSSLYAPVALAVICLASIVAGNTGYYLARRIGHWEVIQRRMARSYDKGRLLFKRFGVWTVVIAGLTPVPFSVVCWLAGLYDMKPSTFFWATLSRIPRFVGWFFLLRLGFSL